MKLNATAYAKVNLTLDVLNKRVDGYHNLKTVMQTVNLADQLAFSPQEEAIEINTDHSGLPTGKDNLVYQAAELLFKEFAIEGGIKIEINKNIPVAGGLAGGSADAAATLRAVNELWELELTAEELMKRAAKLGSDVPFCVVGGTKLATGTGTEITDLPSVPKLNLVVVNPPYKVSTPEIYRNFSGGTSFQATEELLSYLKSENRTQIIAHLKNDLGQTAARLYPELAQLKKTVNQFTTKAIISGSGPTVFGVVEDELSAHQAVDKLAEELTRAHRIIAVQTVNQGIKAEFITAQ